MQELRKSIKHILTEGYDHFSYLPSEWSRAHWKLIGKFTELKYWVASTIATPILMQVEKYLFNDWQFLAWLLELMALDFAMAVLVAKLSSEAVTSFKARSTVVKFIQYAVFLVVMHILSSFEIKGERVDVYDGITSGAYTFLIGVEAFSVLESANKLKSRGIIKKYTDKLREFVKG